MTVVVRLIAVLGCLLFGTLLGFTYSMPDAVERAASGYIRERIVDKTAQRIEAMAAKAADTRLGQLAQKVLKGQEERVDKLKQVLKDRASALLGTVMVRMQNLDCECRDQAAQWLSEGLKLDLKLTTAAVGTLERFLYAQYLDVADRLKRELRIFFGCNLASFAVLLCLSLLRPGASRALLKPTLALLLTVLVCSWCYLKQQNWFYTVLHNRWLGFGYLAWLLLVFGWCLAALKLANRGQR